MKIIRSHQDFGDFLSEELKKSKLKTYEFASFLGIHLISLHAWRKGRQNMTTANLIKISEKLGYQIILKKKGAK